jgi:hypothetical protein
MGPETCGQPIRQSSTARFVLDSHHLAVLDRFVAHARRQARRHGREFRGVVVEVAPSRLVTVDAADLAPLLLGAEAYLDGAALGGVRDRSDAHTHLRLTT